MRSRKAMPSTKGSNDINKYGQLMLRPSVGVTQWLCGGLQIRIRGFNSLSRPHLTFGVGMNGRDGRPMIRIQRIGLEAT